MYLCKSEIHFAFLLDNNWAGYTSRRGPAGIFIRFSTGVLVKQDSETNKNLVKQSPMLPLLTGTRCFSLSLSLQHSFQIFTIFGQQLQLSLSCFPGDIIKTLISERSLDLARTFSLITSYLQLDNKPWKNWLKIPMCYFPLWFCLLMKLSWMILAQDVSYSSSEIEVGAAVIRRLH